MWGKWKKENNNKKTRTKEEKREGERRKSGRHTPRWWKQDVDGRIGLAARARARVHAKLTRRSIEKERKTWWGESGPRRTGATTPLVRSATPRTRYNAARAGPVRAGPRAWSERRVHGRAAE